MSLHKRPIALDADGIFLVKAQPHLLKLML